MSGNFWEIIKECVHTYAECIHGTETSTVFWWCNQHLRPVGHAVWLAAALSHSPPHL